MAERARQGSSARIGGSDSAVAATGRSQPWPASRSSTPLSAATSSSAAVSKACRAVTEAGGAADARERVRHRDPRIGQLGMLAQPEDLDVLAELLEREGQVAPDDQQVVDGRAVTALDDLDAQDVDLVGGEAAGDERQAARPVGQRQADELRLVCAADRVLVHVSASPLGERPHDTELIQRGRASAAETRLCVLRRHLRRRTVRG